MIYKINRRVAQEIVDAAKETIDKNINFIDDSGMVIASTDSNRINTFHEAGLISIKDNRVVVVEDEISFKGAKVGVNYPIIIDGKTLGAIGISGTPESVSKYGFLIIKLTEVFVKEEKLMFESKSKLQKMEYLIKLLIREEYQDIKAIDGYLKTLSLTLEHKVFMAIIETNKDIFKTNDTSLTIHNIDNAIINFFNVNNIMLYSYEYPNKYIAIVDESIYEKFKIKFIATFQKYSSLLYCGISEIATINKLKTPYKNGVIASKYSKNNKVLITESKNIMLDVILSDIKPLNRDKYIKEILQQLSKDEIELLRIYYRNELSLLQTAKDLFIHKNTVQYKLERIYDKISLNPRKYEDSIKIYIALLLL